MSPRLGPGSDFTYTAIADADRLHFIYTEIHRAGGIVFYLHRMMVFRTSIQYNFRRASRGREGCNYSIYVYVDKELCTYGSFIPSKTAISPPNPPRVASHQ